MTLDLLLALSTFAAVTLFTPGPNNVMLMTSGANFGLPRTLPHLFGVAIGFPVMIVPVGLGAMRLFDIWPPAHTVLKVVAVVYMLYLAWKLTKATAPGEGKVGGRPLTFLQAAAFQWVNPKGWSMALGAITLYAASRDLPAVLWVSGVFLVIGTASAFCWVLLGREVRRWLTNARRLRVFNWTMAGLLVASLGMALFL
ncbi:LysE family translocator [Mesobacterium sp. TK19101]|uniref:LysE family translocator n=1 Tax=Mesobacterium hydrothermale TaxID=3111907 RepID=A0ABU6HHC4_9RHOB|nr:LysE family translocator [Mesobacterium sp. TK19101]MEC3861853.1 LysE family translocator [Mesobacterium sp. TK19101]